MFYPKQVDLYTLKVGDTVELANGETREVKSVAYSPSEKRVKVVFTTCKTDFPWIYQRNGAIVANPSASIVKIIPKPKLDFSMNTVDLSTLKEGDTVHLSDLSTDEVVSIARKMLGTIYVIRLRRFGLNHYCVDGCSLDKDKPSIVRIVDTSTAKERVVEILRQNRGRTLRNRVAMSNVEISFGIDPSVTRENLYDALRESTLFAGSTPLGISQFVNSLFNVDLTTLQPGDTVKLANGNTKEVLKVDLQSKAHSNHICVTFADGVWIYNPDGTRPPGRDSAYDIVGVTKITPKPDPTPLTIGGHIVKPGDVLTRAGGDRIVVNQEITWDKARGGWRVWHGAHGNIFFIVDSSGQCSALPSLSITAVVPNLTVPPCRWPAAPSWYLSSSQSPRQGPWPKPITTPPTKKDADPIRQVAVLDKEGDWMQEEWWAACDMLAAGEITGWAHTQAWHDAKNKLSDPWN